MAQLPPKIPTMSSNWPGFGHQRSPTTFLPPAANTAPMQPSWVDEFLDFSAAKRSAHRRSASDSITFLEAPLNDSPLEGRHREHEFDRLDEEQLMSMFSDDAPPNSTISTQSEHDSINEENKHNETLKQPIKNETEDTNSLSEAEPQPPPEAGNEMIMDPKRVKRILANRQSAQRSRVRKLQYISELERSVTCLQTEVSSLSPRVAFFDHQRSILTVGNSALRQRIAALAQDKIFKDAHQEALKKEIERLREVYHKQNLKNMAEEDATPATTKADTAAATENTNSTELND